MELSPSASIHAAFDIFKKRSWFFITITLLTVFLGWAIGFVSDALGNAVGQDASGGAVAFVLSFGLQTLLNMGLVAFYLKAQSSVEQVGAHDLWHPQSFLKYLGASILLALVTTIGFILLIVPGIIFSLMFFFAVYLVIDRNLGPIQALKESARITRGHKWQLLVFLLALLVINIIGILCLVVGLLVSIPVSYLAIVQVYRTLSQAQAAPQVVSA